jgi:hypothetical protein
VDISTTASVADNGYMKKLMFFRYENHGVR